MPKPHIVQRPRTGDYTQYSVYRDRKDPLSEIRVPVSSIDVFIYKSPIKALAAKLRPYKV
jgi:hypothetical protein